MCSSSAVQPALLYISAQELRSTRIEYEKTFHVARSVMIDAPMTELSDISNSFRIRLAMKSSDGLINVQFLGHLAMSDRKDKTICVISNS
jgi:hypothetical protein